MSFCEIPTMNTPTPAQSILGLIAWLVFGQSLDGPALLGMGLIVAGVLVINLFSKSVAH